MDGSPHAVKLYIHILCLLKWMVIHFPFYASVVSFHDIRSQLAILLRIGIPHGDDALDLMTKLASDNSNSSLYAQWTITFFHTHQGFSHYPSSFMEWFIENGGPSYTLISSLA
jgi:hypothetical protein